MTEEAAVDWLLTPESEDTEADADEAPERTEAEDTEADEDAREDADDTEADEADDEDEDDADEDADDDSDEEEQTEGQTFRVKVDGQEVSVTLDELKRGYSGQAYIQKGMEEAKQFQSRLKQAAEAMAQERQQFLQLYEQAQQTGFKPAPQPPKREMMQNDPIGYMEARAQYEDDLQAYQQEQEQVQLYQQRQQQMTQAQRSERLKQEAQRLIEAIPELGDATKAPKIRERLVNVATAEYGMTAEEVDSIADSRFLRVLHDAAQYQAIRAGKAEAKQPRATQKVVTKPKGRATTAKRTQAQKQLQRAMKTQSDEDWVNVLLQS